jgi:hypothetical protein
MHRVRLCKSMMSFFVARKMNLIAEVSKEGIEDGAIGNNLLYNAQGCLMYSTTPIFLMSLFIS